MSQKRFIPSPSAGEVAKLIRQSAAVAIWTGSQKQTAVECLCELGFGLVGPKLVGPERDQADLLHPKLVALWAREDFGLTRKDFYSYVAVVKDLSRLWRHLVRSGCSRCVSGPELTFSMPE